MYFVFHFFENAQALRQTWPAKAAHRSAISLVVRRLKNERNIQRASDALDDLRHEQGVLLALNHAGPGNQEQIAGTDTNALDLERNTHRIQNLSEGCPLCTFVPLVVNAFLTVGRLSQAGETVQPPLPLSPPAASIHVRKPPPRTF